MADESPAPPSRCNQCTRGRIILLTSDVQCAACLGTGFVLNRLAIDICVGDLELMVRTRKFLLRNGIETLGQLMAFVLRNPPEGLEVTEITINEIGRALSDHGLPTGRWKYPK